MSTDRETWFRDLEPPPGGAERLRLRLEEARRPTTVLAPRLAAVGTGAAALVLAIALFTGLRNDDGANGQTLANVYQAASFDRLLGRPIERTELRVTVDARAVAVSRDDGSNPNVRIYRLD